MKVFGDTRILRGTALGHTPTEGPESAYKRQLDLIIIAGLSVFDEVDIAPVTMASVALSSVDQFIVLKLCNFVFNMDG